MREVDAFVLGAALEATARRGGTLTEGLDRAGVGMSDTHAFFLAIGSHAMNSARCEPVAPGLPRSNSEAR